MRATLSYRSNDIKLRLLCFLLCTLTDVDLKKIENCVGDHSADVVNPVLKAEQDAQVNS